MNPTRLAMLGSLSVALLSAFGSPPHLHGGDQQIPYPKMAPLSQYLMDSTSEIALARSAAPESVSRDAAVLVLGPHGYKSVASGKSGFVCLVLRSWTAPFADPGFWNPKIRGPVCYNPPAARSVLPVIEKRTNWILAGLAKSQVIDSIKAAVAKHTLRPPEPGSMSYMMSKHAYLTDDGSHNLAHLMFEVPPVDSGAWGAGLAGSPVMLLSAGGPDPMTEFAVSVRHWSDGTAVSVSR